MARMFPAGFPDDWKSEAEHDIFEMLRDQLSQEWICLHSVGLARHDRKVWAEIDFVIIGPTGLFCLEVKGGYVGREEGAWIFRNRHGHENRKAEGPFEQVGSAAGALKGFFRANDRSVLASIVGHGVVMPDVIFTLRGPDVDAELVLDQASIRGGMRAYVERLTDVWARRFREQRRSEPRTLTREDREAILELLRGDFDLVPSLPTRIGWVRDELVRLTQQQSDYLARLEENPRVLVRGGAGTGKTVLAAEEAARAAQSGARVLMLCFSRLLAESLSPAAGEGVTVSTLHSLMSNLIRDAGLEGELPAADENDLYEVFFPVLSLQALALPTRPLPYDFLVIDEAQDILLPNYLDVLDALLRCGLKDGRWRIFYDANQNIFNGVGLSAMERILALDPVRYTLTMNCRNTEQVAAATAMFSGCTLLEASAQGPKIETLWYRNRSEQRKSVSNYVRRLLSQGVRPSDIVVLSSKTLRNSCLADGWHGTVEADLVDVAERRPNDSSAVGFSSIAAFKGLESDAVVLLDAVTAQPSSRYLTYVGASRARALLAIFLDQEEQEEITARYAEFGTSIGLLGLDGLASPRRTTGPPRIPESELEPAARLKLSEQP